MFRFVIAVLSCNVNEEFYLWRLALNTAVYLGGQVKKLNIKNSNVMYYRKI